MHMRMPATPRAGAPVRRPAPPHAHLLTPALRTTPRAAVHAQRAGLHATDEAMRVGGDAYAKCGTTALVALLLGRRVYVANVGDSRAVLCRRGRCIELSTDHKPGDSAERLRIEARACLLCVRVRCSRVAAPPRRAAARGRACTPPRRWRRHAQPLRTPLLARTHTPCSQEPLSYVESDGGRLLLPWLRFRLPAASWTARGT
jgi:hypothetical protein